MTRVPLPLRGVAVLLLAASTALGQTGEPPVEFTLDPSSPNSSDLLRQFSSESHNPLINLMVDGEFTALDAAPPKENAKIKPTPQAKTAEKEIEVDAESCPGEVECPTAPNCLPFAYCPPPPQQQCHCRKCQRKQRCGHRGGCGNGCGNGYGNGNPYLGWPGCPICFYGAPLVPCEGGCGGCRKHQRRGCGHSCGGNQGYGCGYGYGCGSGGWQGWNTMCGDGGWNQGCGGCMPYVAPPPQQQQCHCRKCQRQRKHGCGNSGCGNSSGYGYGYGGGWNMGYGGYMDCCGGCWTPPPQQQCQCRRCQRKHGGSNNCNYGGGYGCCSGNGYGYGYPGWAGGYEECNQGCGRRRHSRCHRNQGCQQPQPYACFGCPMMMPCMGGELLCGEGAFGSDF